MNGWKQEKTNTPYKKQQQQPKQQQQQQPSSCFSPPYSSSFLRGLLVLLVLLHFFFFSLPALGFAILNRGYKIDGLRKDPKGLNLHPHHPLRCPHDWNILESQLSSLGSSLGSPKMALPALHQAAVLSQPPEIKDRPSVARELTTWTLVPWMPSPWPFRSATCRERM